MSRGAPIMSASEQASFDAALARGASGTGLQAFNEAFHAYIVWNKRDAGFLVEDRGRKVRFELWKQFSAIAATKDGLRAELVALGYRFKRRKGPDGKTLTPEQEIRARLASRKFLSASFIFGEWGLSRTGTTGKFTSLSRARGIIGAAIVNTARGTEAPFVALTSYLEGVVTQNRRRGIVDKALRRQAADMAVYCARKHQEKLHELFSRSFEELAAA